MCQVFVLMKALREMLLNAEHFLQSLHTTEVKVNFRNIMKNLKTGTTGELNYQLSQDTNDR